MRKILLFLLLFPLFTNAITPVFCCGFECGVNWINGGSNLGQHWQFWTANTAFSTSTVRTGARSLRINPSGATEGFALSQSFSQTVVVVRFYFNIASNPTADCLFGPVHVNNGTADLGVGYNPSDGKIYVCKKIGATETFGSTGVTLTAGWHYADVIADVSANPWVISAKLDGTDLGSINHAAAATILTNITLNSSGTSTNVDIYFDDVISSYTSADYPIGPGYVSHFVPTSDGSHSGITAADYEETLTGTDILNSTTTSYQLLDDVPLESGASVNWVNMVAPVASSYVENVFGPAPGISTPTTAPRIASVIVGYHQAGTGTGTMELLLNDNGTTAAIYTASIVAGVTAVNYKVLTLADPPSAASTWTLSGNGNFNNIRVRFGPTGTVDANPDQYFDCAMIEAEFEEIANTIPGTPSDKRHTTLGVGYVKPRLSPNTR